MTSTFWKYHQWTLNSRGPQNSLKFDVESEITNLLVSQNKKFPGEWWTVWVLLSARLIFASFVCFCPEWRWWLWILNHFHSIRICIQSTGNSRDYCEISRRNTIPFKISWKSHRHVKICRKNVNYLLDHLIIFQNIGTIPIFQYSSTDYEFKY